MRKKKSYSLQQEHPLEILLAPHEIEPLVAFAVHVAFDMELGAQPLGTTEEHTRLTGGMQFADRPEDHVPIGAAEVGGRAQARDSVGVAAVEHNVVCV